jgi:RNA-directed DNA polymerase
VSEEGEWKETKVGTPQGAAASPLLANIYLHYVFDLWVNQWRRKSAQGDMIVVRYADDAVLGFEHRNEAEAFLEQLRERMRKFGLELHPEKTRLIEFGRFAEVNREAERRGETRDLRFSGFYAYLRDNPEGWLVQGAEADGQEAAAEQTASGPAGVAQALA